MLQKSKSGVLNLRNAAASPESAGRSNRHQNAAPSGVESGVAGSFRRALSPVGVSATLRPSVRFACDENRKPADDSHAFGNGAGRRDVHEPQPQQQRSRPAAAAPAAKQEHQQNHNNQRQATSSCALAANLRRKMADHEKEETVNLQVEFEWVLHEEVHSVLKNLHTILVECAHRFPVPLYGNEGRKIDKFSLILPQDGLKCIVTLTGDSITHADICYKLQRFQNQIQRVAINPESPWKLQQVQDAANHLQQAIHHIDNVDSSYNFKSSDEVLHILGNILAALQRGRTSLVTPKKKPIDELMKSRNMKSLTPNLPDDQAISFYLQSHKLIFAVYQLINVQGVMKFESSHAECSVPWLNEVLVLFTVALQLCQQLKDKISVFSQYKDFTVGSRSPSALSY